jgi:MFS superfamily sulfate permease-like transporter
MIGQSLVSARPTARHQPRYGDARCGDARTFPGLLIWRIGGDLLFASVSYMETALKRSIAEIRPSVKHVLLDFSSVNYIDVSACDELSTSSRSYKAKESLSPSRVYAMLCEKTCNSVMKPL